MTRIFAIFLFLATPVLAQPSMTEDMFDYADNCIDLTIGGDTAQAVCQSEVQNLCYPDALPEGVADCTALEARIWEDVLSATVTDVRAVLSNMTVEGRDLAGELDAAQTEWQRWSEGHCALATTMAQIMSDTDLGLYCRMGCCVRGSSRSAS